VPAAGSGICPANDLHEAIFAIDIEKCEKCGGPVRIIVDASNRSIEDPDVIQKILKHLGLDPPGDPQNRSPHQT
jgi:hypothetical protein